MRVTEHVLKHEFINLLLNILDSKGLRTIYNLNCNAKYSIDYIVDVIIAVSQKAYTRFRIPNELATYFNESIYSKYSKTYLKTLIKQQLSTTTDNLFFNTYVVIGHDVPVTIKDLQVVC
jgi:hypothetical protein